MAKARNVSKRETWQALVFLLHHGTVDELQAVWQVVSEAQGSLLLQEALFKDREFVELLSTERWRLVT